MHTFFDLKVKETNGEMREFLAEIVVPFLQGEGWQGKRTRFRRIKNGMQQTLEIQFNKWGGSLAVNLGNL